MNHESDAEFPLDLPPLVDLDNLQSESHSLSTDIMNWLFMNSNKIPIDSELRTLDEPMSVERLSSTDEEAISMKMPSSESQQHLEQMGQIHDQLPNNIQDQIYKRARSEPVLTISEPPQKLTRCSYSTPRFLQSHRSTLTDVFPGSTSALASIPECESLEDLVSFLEADVSSDPEVEDPSSFEVDAHHIFEYAKSHKLNLKTIARNFFNYFSADSKLVQFVSFLEMRRKMEIGERLIIGSSSNYLDGHVQLEYVSPDLFKQNDRMIRAMNILRTDLMVIAHFTGVQVKALTDGQGFYPSQSDLLLLLKNGALEIQSGTVSAELIRMMGIRSESMAAAVAEVLSTTHSKLLAIHLLHFLSISGTHLTTSQIQNVKRYLKTHSSNAILMEVLDSQAWGSPHFLRIENGLISKAPFHVFVWAFEKTPVLERGKLFSQLLNEQRDRPLFEAFLKRYRSFGFDGDATNMFLLATQYQRTDVFDLLIQYFDPQYEGKNWSPATYWRVSIKKAKLAEMTIICQVFWRYEDKIGDDPDEFFLRLRPSIQIGLIRCAPMSKIVAIDRRFKTVATRLEFLKQVARDPIADRNPLTKHVVSLFSRPNCGLDF